jgi:RHS repeat-associated protein
MKSVRAIVSFCVVIGLSTLLVFGQSAPNLENGVKSFGSYDGSSVDTVNLQNGNVMVHIPLFSYPQRGKMALSFSARLNSKNWQVGEYTDSNQALLYRWMLAGKPGFALAPSYDVQMHRVRTMTTDLQGTQTEYDYDYAVSTPDGSIHWLSAVAPNGNMMTGDGTNFQFHLTRGVQYDHADDSGVLTDSNGLTYYFPSLSMSIGKESPASGISANIYAHVLEWRNTKLPDGANEQITYHDVGIPSKIVDPNGNAMVFTVGTDGLTISGPSFDVTGRPIPFEQGNTPAAAAPDFSGCATSSTTTSAYLFDFPGPSGQSSTVKACFTGLNLAPTFSQPNVEPPKNDTLFKSYPTGSIQAPLTTLIMPDGTTWTFTYDLYGNITSIGLPTGGSITYNWTEVSLPTCMDDTKVSRAVATRTINDPVNPPQIWQYTWGTAQPDGSITNYVLDPNGNETAHVFNPVVPSLPCDFRETETRTYSGPHASGTLLKTVDTHYIGYGSDNSEGSFLGVVLPDVITTTLPGNKVSKITRQYDSGNVAGAIQSYGTVTDEKVYDYGTNSPGPLLKETATTYQRQANSAYFDAGHIDLPQSVVVKDGSGCKMSETDYAYDESAYPNVSYEGTVGALPAGTHQAVNAPNGNLTTVTRLLFDHSTCSPAAQTSVSSHTRWYDTGEVYQQIDPLGRTTTISYDPAYVGTLATSTCSPSTNGVAHCVSATYDTLTGLVTSFTNENATTQASGNTPGDSAHTSSYIYDSSWRPKSGQAPPDPLNGGASAQTSFNYGTAYPFSIQRQKSITNALTDVSTTYLDGAGRANHVEHSTPNGASIVMTNYNGLGQATSVTNPYFTTADPTYGITQSYYDGLGRVYSVTKQDGSIASVSFNANCATTMDEAGAQRRTCSDALGRLIEVDEPGVSQIGAQAQATVDIGAMKSVMVGGHAAANAIGSITLSGVEQVKDIPGARYCAVLGTRGTCLDWEFYDDTFIYDYGTVKVSVNGQLFSYTYSSADSVSTIANALAGSIRASSATTDYSSVVVNTSTTPPTATIFLIARSANAAGNSITLSLSATSYDTTDFAAASFNPSVSGADLTGGIDFYAGTQVIDSGTVTISVGSFTSPALSYGPSTANSTAPQVAAALATALAGSGFTATLTPGSTVLTITDTVPRASSNGAAVQVHPVTGDPGDFPVASFNASGTLSGGADQIWTTLGNLTLYQYDGLGNLLCVEQHGGVTGTGCSAAASSDATSPWRVRRFTYDSLGRILTAKNPESGTISYLYDADGNLSQKTSPLANQTGSATQTVSYCYDALHRVTGKGYGAQSCPLATPVVSYVYDFGANAIGKLSSLTDQAGTASYSYDSLGRLTAETRVISGVSKSMSYSYNLDSSLKTLTNPSGAVITYTPDSAGRILSAVDSGSGINYVTAATYGRDSELTGFVSGNSGTFAGITNAYSYNKRLQPVNMSATAPSQTVYSIGYDFHAGNGTAATGMDNGNVFGITNYKDTTRNQSFTYDALNRLTSAQNAGTNCAANTVNGKTEYWGNSYGYDAWGNLLAKTITKCSAEHLSVTADAHNWIHAPAPDYQYDAAGNMTYDATASLNYTFDQENRLTGAAGYTYTYDVDGNRVKKSNSSTGTLYWHMTPGIVAESDLSGALQSEYVFFDGKRVARKDFPSNAIAYYFSDNLKTASVITDSAGAIKAESDYYPWGGELQFVNNDSNDYKFTGKRRDTESQLDYFGARYYSNAYGRFLTPDWAAKATSVPYAEFADPQSLNLYTYVRNIPTTGVDPDGHCGNTFCQIAAGVATGVGKFVWNNSPAGMAVNGMRQSYADMKAGPAAAEAHARGQLHALGTVAAAVSGDKAAQAQILGAAANTWNNASTTDKASMATQGVLTAAAIAAGAGVGGPSSSAPSLVGFSEGESAMIGQSLKNLSGAGYDLGPMQQLIKADMPPGCCAMSLSTPPTGAALGDGAFTSQGMLDHTMEEELLHLNQNLPNQTFGPGTAAANEAEVNAARKFPEPKHD